MHMGYEVQRLRILNFGYYRCASSKHIFNVVDNARAHTLLTPYLDTSARGRCEHKDNVLRSMKPEGGFQKQHS